MSDTNSDAQNTKTASGDDMTEAAKRALSEAEERRARKDEDAAELPEDEAGGPTKIEPTRYGDWERKGIAYDF